MCGASGFGRDIARRKDGVLRSCVEGAIAFGLERDTLAKFLPVANETELALKEQEVIDEALEALRSSARRYDTTVRPFFGRREGPSPHSVLRVAFVWFWGGGARWEC